jgi:DNA-binding response OmpR family regulator
VSCASLLVFCESVHGVAGAGRMKTCTGMELAFPWRGIRPYDSPAPMTGSPARILVVDHQDDGRGFLATALRLDHHDVDGSRNGSDALRRLEQVRYDLIVSALRMPGLDGPALYRRVLRRWPNEHPAVLFVSDSVEAPPYAAFLDLVRVPLLLKPFTSESLAGRVRRLLDQPTPLARPRPGDPVG